MFEFVSTLSKGRNFTINSFHIVSVFGNKVECCFDEVERCFDTVTGVDGALSVTAVSSHVVSLIEHFLVHGKQSLGSVYDSRTTGMLTFEHIYDQFDDQGPSS